MTSPKRCVLLVVSLALLGSACSIGPLEESKDSEDPSAVFDGPSDTAVMLPPYFYGEPIVAGEHDGALIVWGEWMNTWGEGAGEYVASDRGARIERGSAWQALPEPPFDGPTNVFDGAVAAGHLLILGATCTDPVEAFETLRACGSVVDRRAAVLDLENGEWQQIEPPFSARSWGGSSSPYSIRHSITAYSAGDKVLVSVAEDDSGPAAWRAYDFEAERWVDVSAPPANAERAEGSIEGRRVTVREGEYEGPYEFWVAPES